jgi:hypothetical protein
MRFRQCGEPVPFRSILDPEHRAILTAALDDICAVARIEPQSPQGEKVASLILQLYGNAYQTGLKAMLDTQMDETNRQG